MAFTKITNTELNARGATTLPNQPTISATALKQEFDAPAKNVVAPKFNNLIDELESTTASASLGAVAPSGHTGSTVQAVINSIASEVGTLEGQIPVIAAQAHSHPNKDLLDTYTQTEADIASAVADDHTHSNKALLDTYEQTETNLADAVSKKHEHSNLALLETYTQTEANLSDAVDKKHSHSNKSLLDSYDQSNSDIEDAVSKKHSHSNKSLLDTYTQTESDLSDAVSKKHTHSNKAVIDKFGEDSSGNPTYDGDPIGGGGTGNVNDAYKTVKVGTVSLVATGEDTLILKGGSNVTLSVDNVEKSVTINSTGGGGQSTGDMLASDYDSDYDVKNAGGIKAFVNTAATYTGEKGVIVSSKKVKADLANYQASLLASGSATSAQNRQYPVMLDANDHLSVNIPWENTEYNDATTTASGLMSSTDKSKLNNIEANANNYSLPTASTNTLGGVKVDGTTITIDANGVISSHGGGGTTIVQIPSVVGDSFTYNGIAQGPTITGLDATHCTVTGATAINAGSYTLTIALNDPSSMVWSDLTTADKTYSYTIAKANQTLTLSKNSVTLDANTLTDTVTVSGASTSLSATSSDDTVASASVSGSTVTISNVNQKTGTATISISAAADANHNASAAVSVSVTATFSITKTITVYSAASDTLTFTDESGSKTVTTDSSGVGSASVTILPNGSSITFTSSVAKNPSDLSADYSKTVNVTSSTTAMYVMPDNALYWYGYKNNLEDISTANGWTGSTFIAPTYNTNNIRLSSSAGKLSGIGNKNAITGITKLCAICQGITAAGGHHGVIASNASKNTNGAPQYTTITENVITYKEIQASNSYVFIDCESGRVSDVYAMWYE